MTKRTLLLLLFIVIKLLLHCFLINSGYDLHRDEYLHLDQAHHLAWGYESVPPFSSWIAYIILQLGNAVFWIKFFPALFGALTIVFIWKTIETLNGNLFALIMGATAVCFSAILRINILFQPNSFDILSWTLFYYIIVKYINSRQNKWLYFAAIAFALGFLNKYNIVFLLLGIVPAILLTEHKILFLNKHFYLAIAVSLLIIAPNIAWQFNNKFPVFHHMKELSETQLVNVHRSDFLKEQLLFFLGSVYVLIVGLLSFFIYPGFKKYRLFFWSYLFTLCIFTYFKAKGYYAIGLYPVLIAFGAVYLERLTQNGWKKWLRPVCIFIPVALFMPFVKLLFPVLGPTEIAQRSKTETLNRWEDGKIHSLPQDFADMLGWRELAAKTDSAYLLVNDKEHTLVLCDNYGEAGAINYYSRQNIHAVSMNADYINWFPFGKNILHIISVKENSDTGLIREKNIFDTLIKSGEVNNDYAREKGTVIFILSGAKADVNSFLKEEIRKRKF